MKLMKLNVFILGLIFILLNGFNLYSQDIPKKLLAIFAHPDDEQTIAPLLVKLVEEEVEVTLVIATDGRLGVNEYTDYEAGEGLAEIRKQEMLCAAEVLGVNLIHLDYHDQLKAAEGFDGHIPHVQDLIFELKNIVKTIQPDAIITWGPDGATTHMDHRLVGASVTQIFVSQQWEKAVELFYFGIPSDLITDERAKTLRGQQRRFLTVQIPFNENHYDKAYQALLCHESQYPPRVVEKIKMERKQLGKTLYLRQFMAPTKIRTSLF